MATEPDIPEGNQPASPESIRVHEAHNEPAQLKPSKPLQIFLLLALLVTGAAYVVNEWTRSQYEQVTANHPSKLKKLVDAQIKYMTETDLGREAEAKKKYEEAVIHYRNALTAEENAPGRLNLGNALLKQGNPDMAFSQFKAALRLDPGLESVYIAWGQALTLQGKTDDAIQLYQDALRQKTNFALVQYNFARVLSQKQQTAQAMARADALASQTQEAARATDEARLMGSDALKHFVAAEGLGLNTAEFWCSYGTLLNQLGNFAGAEIYLDKAVALQPGLGEAEFQLALAEDRLGKYADAVGHYEATLAALPDDPAALNNLALLYATATNGEVRSTKMAVLLATRACDATTDQNPRYMDTLARAYASDGDFFQAISWEDKAVRRATQLDDHDLLRELQPRFNLFVQHRSE